MALVREYNFDGLVGMSHHFGGLSLGNLASMQHRLQLSHPRAAALQGLAKMRVLLDLGVKQGFFLPPETPRLPLLREEGFTGSDMKVLEGAARYAPELFRAAYSASSMWAANMATVSPSFESNDHRCHLSPANLWTQLHRRWEARATPHVLDLTFPDRDLFVRHDALPGELPFADEGAANHLRLSPATGQPGLQVFVYGFDPEAEADDEVTFPARQSWKASIAVAEQHELEPEQVFFIKQNPGAVDAGVFHNDVAAVAHENLLLIHAQAWANQAEVLQQLHDAYQKICGQSLKICEIAAAELSLEEAVATYFFNSQIVRGEDGERVLIAPQECEDHPQVRPLIDSFINSAKIFSRVIFINLSESMANGGGPACLRLCLELTEAEAATIHPGFMLDEARLTALEKWVDWHYRENLVAKDFLDPSLLKDIHCALDELTQICECGAVYAFQQ